MAEIKTKTDSAKLKNLKVSLLKLKQELDNVNKQINQAIGVVSQTWKDFKFKDFQEAYKTYQAGITKFENDLETVANKTLPPIIQAAEDIEKENLKSGA